MLPSNWYFPTTRYRGSKRKILPWIWESIKDLSFETCLDLFGGTGTVSLLFKWMGKQVTYNDYLFFNYQAAIALLENKSIKITEEDLEFIFEDHSDILYNKFISNTFKGYFFLDEENVWLDKIVNNIFSLDRIYLLEELRIKRALAIYALGQACLVKRPFNLFHRKNLSLRTREVERSFGNKTTWEIPFPAAFQRYMEEANLTIFDNGWENKALCTNALEIHQNNYDLVYMDPPYFFPNQKDNDYRKLYHFIDGIARWEEWPDLVDYESINLRFKDDDLSWHSKSTDGLIEIYSQLIERFQDSIIVISHKSGSKVPIGTIKKLLNKKNKQVQMRRKRYNYALNKKNGRPRQNIEWLIIAT